MQDNSKQELTERLDLIESMIAEGRRKTERWGWTFVLWGLVYYLAIAWSTWGHTGWAWPVTMSIGAIITVAVASSKSGDQPETTLGRAVGSIWIALGISMFLLFMALGVSGRLSDPHIFVAVTCAMLGMANAASGFLLRWKIQVGCALVWWAAVVVSCFGTQTDSMIAFLAALFFCQILFGIYGMISESQARRRHGPLHA